MGSSKKPVRTESSKVTTWITDRIYTFHHEVTMYVPLLRHTDKAGEGLRLGRLAAYRTFTTTLN